MSKFSRALELYNRKNGIPSITQASIEKTEAFKAEPEDGAPSSQPSPKLPEQIALNEPMADSNSSSVNNIDKNLISIKKPNSMEADLFKVLRGKILFPVSGNPPRSILVTSAAPGDGKSFIASNLAVNLAQNIDETVLLVDCDLRRPSIHKNFGFNHVKGLSEHLSNQTRLSDLFLKTVVDKLTLLPAGKPPANPSEILSSARMAVLIDELKSRYHDRYLIIDSPPPLMGPETDAIAKRVDGIIIVIKCGSTPFDLVDQMIRNMGKEKIIGAVINQYDMPSSRHYSYRKYSKYYKKYHNRSRVQASDI